MKPYQSLVSLTGIQFSHADFAKLLPLAKGKDATSKVTAFLQGFSSQVFPDYIIQSVITFCRGYIAPTADDVAGSGGTAEGSDVPRNTAIKANGNAPVAQGGGK